MSNHGAGHISPRERFEANQRLAYKVLHRFCKRRGAHSSDYEAAALSGLYHAARHYKIGRGRFSTYAWKCIECALKSEHQSNQWYSKNPKCTLDYPLERLPDPAPSPSGDKMGLRDLLDSVLRFIDKRQRQCLEMRFGIGHPDECTLEEVGRSVGVTKERARRIIVEAMLKLSREYDLYRLAEQFLAPDDRSHNSRPAAPVSTGEADPLFEDVVRCFEDTLATV